VSAAAVGLIIVAAVLLTHLWRVNPRDRGLLVASIVLFTLAAIIAFKS
jgi:hypothetical protein